MNKDDVVLKISSKARDMSNSIYASVEVFDKELHELLRLRAELNQCLVRFDTIEPNGVFQNSTYTGTFVKLRPNQVEEMGSMGGYGVAHSTHDWSPVFFKKSELVIPMNSSPLTVDSLNQIYKWVLDQIALIDQSQGKPGGARQLNPNEIDLASLVGVRNPQQVLVLEVDEMPSPPQGLELLAEQFLDPSHAAGLTLGYCILIKRGCYSRQLMQHELRHIQQVEFYGLARFLEEYLNQVVHCGYRNAPFELDAIEASNSGIKTY